MFLSKIQSIGMGSEERSRWGDQSGLTRHGYTWKQISPHGYNLKAMQSNLKTPKRNVRTLQPGNTFAFYNSRGKKQADQAEVAVIRERGKGSHLLRITLVTAWTKEPPKLEQIPIDYKKWVLSWLRVLLERFLGLGAR